MIENKIKYKDVTDFLDSNSYAYKCLNNSSDKFIIASIYNPVNKGFYYLTGNFRFNPENCLLLINSSIDVSMYSDSNYFIIVDGDVQRVYYEIIRAQFLKTDKNEIHPTAIISKKATLGENVKIGAYSVIGDVIIEEGVEIGNHCTIEDNSVLRRNCRIDHMSVIGASGLAWVWDQNKKERVILPQLGGVEIGENTLVAANALVVRGSLNEFSKIGRNSVIGPGSRLGHGTIIGEGVHLANDVVTAGNTCIGSFCFIGSGAIFKPGVQIANHTIVGAGAVVLKNVETEKTTIAGLPAKEIISSKAPSGMPKPLD